MAVLGLRKKSEWKFPSFNDTLTSGITKSDYSKHIVDEANARFYGDPANHVYTTEFTVNSLIKAVTNASLGFGEHVMTYPLGLIRPLFGSIELTTLCTTGTTSTGEAGLGTVIASGAVTTLGGTVTFGNQMDGTTLADLTAATTETNFLYNLPDLTGTKATGGVMIFDGSATAVKCFLNISHDFDASENLTFSAKVKVGWQWCGTGLAS